jgi:hypothetical protein
LASPAWPVAREQVMSQGFRTQREECPQSADEPLEQRTEDDTVRCFDMLCEDLDLFCESNIDLASPAAIRRKQQMQKRLAFVQTLWNDADRFDAIIATGRYLKLCHLTEWISDCDEQAWARVKSEILAARQRLNMRVAS